MVVVSVTFAFRQRPFLGLPAQLYFAPGAMEPPGLKFFKFFHTPWSEPYSPPKISISGVANVGRDAAATNASASASGSP